MTKTVLITGIGGDVAQGVATILQSARPDLNLVGVDMHGRHGGRLFVRRFEEIPPASEASYRDKLLSVIQRHKVDFVIPMSEPELTVLFPDLYKALGAIWITPGEGVIRAGLDKFATANSLKKLGLPVPWTVLAEESMPQEYPCIFKSRHGSGSRIIFRIEAAGDAKAISSRFPDGIFQELLLPDNQEVTCAVYRTRDGRTKSVLMLRRLMGGVTGWAETITDDRTSEMCLHIAEGLQLKGSMNIQLRLTERGPRVFEINPRFSSTALMRHLIGFRDVVWAVEEAEGIDVKFPEIPLNQVLVRTQGAKIMQGHREE